MSAKIKVDPGYAWCGRCKAQKPIDQFARSKRRANGRQARCKACNKEYREGDGKLGIVERTLLAKYGITLDQYLEKHEEQKGLCAICHRPETARSTNGAIKMLAVDHCHEELHKRGLLCQGCNTALGQLSTVELLQSAISYLESRWEV